MISDAVPAVDRIVFESCRELLAAYGLEADARAAVDVPSEQLFCGVLGFGGRQLRGSIVIAATREPLELTSPARGTSQRDWICELANQLAGRAKSKLLAHGIEILLATPASLSGESLYPIGLRRRGLQVLFAASGIVCAWADYELAPGFAFPSTPPGDLEAPLAEGEMLLF